MTKIQMIQTIGVSDIENMILFLPLGHLIFEFVSNFDIRPALARHNKLIYRNGSSAPLSLFDPDVECNGLGQGFRIFPMAFA